MIFTDLTRFSRSLHFWSRISQKGLSHYRTLIENRVQSIEWYHFQWPWLSLDWDFKVVLFFDIEYLRNDTRQSHNYYRTSIESHRRSIEWWHFQWFWGTLNQVFKVTAFWSRISQKQCVLGTMLLWCAPVQPRDNYEWTDMRLLINFSKTINRKNIVAKWQRIN